jgi:formamidopyrimidine-DNA glycosylase
VLDHDFLVVHLKMTGRLYVTAADAIYDADRWLRLHLDLDNGLQLRFSDPRKFGRVYLTGDLATITGALGPEPLADDFSPADFVARLAGRRRCLKALLLDQGFIAGVGNIYADEALHRAGLHPLRRADTLTTDEATRLYHSIRAALSDGITHEGASINWYRKPDGTRGESQNHFFVYGRDGQPCRACGHPIDKIRVAQRGTHFCRVCQPEQQESSAGGARIDGV